MKTKDKIMQRPWIHIGYHWRAVDKDGGDYYYLHKPEKHDEYEWRNNAEQLYAECNWPIRFVSTIQLECIEDWEDTLQSYDEYLQLANQQP